MPPLAGTTRGDRTEPATLARYEDDAVTWARQQAALLRAGRFADIDVANIADEIADVARREYDKLVNALARVLQHMLKWDFQPERRSRSWVLSIKEHRARVRDQLYDHRGLKSMLDKSLERAYRTGRSAALIETGLAESVIPETSPYGWTEMMERAVVLPDE